MKKDGLLKLGMQHTLQIAQRFNFCNVTKLYYLKDNNNKEA